VAFLGVLALGVSGWVIWHSLTALGRLPQTQTNINTSAVAKLNELRDQDTDGDKLSDYDELFQYSTSPYLKDSDSDGVSDYDELAKKQDPNCPKGKTCTSVAGNATTTDSSGQLTPAFLRQALREAGVAQAVLDGMDDLTLLKVYNEIIPSVTNDNTNGPVQAPTLDNLENLSAAEIRQLMIDSGVDKATLDKVDDASLKEIFNKAIEDANSNTNQ